MATRMKSFLRLVDHLLEISPGIMDGMIRYMIDVVMSDQIITEDEIAFLYEFGGKIGLSRIEVVHIIAETIQQKFVPSFDSIC